MFVSPKSRNKGGSHEYFRKASVAEQLSCVITKNEKGLVETALASEESVVEEPVTEDDDVHMENDPEDPQGLGVPYASYILHDADIPYD